MFPEIGLFRRRFFECVLIISLLVLLIMTSCINNQQFSFGVIADVQYADRDTWESRNYRKAIDKLAESITELNKSDAAFVVQLGDAIDGGEGAAGALEEVVAEFDKLNVPIYHVIGNHDLWDIDRQSVFEKLGLKSWYYDFEQGGWRFIVLDTMDIAVTGGWGEDSENYRRGREVLDELIKRDAPNAVEWSGGVGAGQMDWLRKILADAENKGQKVIVFGHIPLMPPEEIHTLWNSEEVVKVLQSYDCVKAYFAGHRHGGGYDEDGGIHYPTIEGVVDAPDENAYAIVHVFSDRLEIEGIGKVPDRVLYIDIK